MLGILPLHFKNYLEAGIYVGVVLVLSLFNPMLGFLMLHVAALTLWSLRSTPRPFLPSSNHYLSPIDGRVIEVNKSYMRDGVECIKISIETKVYDSHAQYAPISGKLMKVENIESRGQIEIKQINFKTNFDMVTESGLITEIVDTRNNNRCVIETIAKPILPLSVQVVEGIDYKSEFIEQGAQLGIWHFVPCSSFTTHIYLDLGSTVEIEVGQSSIGGQTILAFKGSKIMNLETILSHSQSQH